MKVDIESLWRSASFQLTSYEQALCLTRSVFLSQSIWVAVRGVLFLYGLAILVWGLVESSKYYATFLTNWMLVTEVVYLLLAVTVSWLLLEPPPRASPGSDYVVSPMVDDLLTSKWALRSIVAPGALLVVVGFWAAVDEDGGTSALNVHVHGINLAILLVDATFSASPFHLLHVWALFLFGAAYVAFTVSYFYSTNDAVYVALNYTRQALTTAIVLTSMLAIIPLAVLVVWCYFHLRNAFTIYVLGISPVPKPPATEFSAAGGEVKEADAEQRRSIDEVAYEMYKARQWIDIHTILCPDSYASGSGGDVGSVTYSQAVVDIALEMDDNEDAER